MRKDSPILLNTAGWALLALLLGATAGAVQSAPEEKAPQPQVVTKGGTPLPEETEGTEADEAVPAPRPGLPLAKGPVKIPRVLDPKTGKTVILITNSDLERIYGKSVVPRASAVAGAPVPETAALPAPPGGGPDPGSKVNEISQELERQKKLLSTMTNPYQSRPKLTEEEKAARKGKSAAELYRETREKVSNLESEMKKWREKQAEEKPEPGGSR